MSELCGVNTHSYSYDTVTLEDSLEKVWHVSAKQLTGQDTTHLSQYLESTLCFRDIITLIRANFLYLIDIRTFKRAFAINTLTNLKYSRKLFCLFNIFDEDTVLSTNKLKIVRFNETVVLTPMRLITVHITLYFEVQVLLYYASRK